MRPEVECTDKGKAHARFEFGVTVSIAPTSAWAPGGPFVVGMQALPGNPMTATPSPSRSRRPSGSPESRSSAPPWRPRARCRPRPRRHDLGAKIH